MDMDMDMDMDTAWMAQPALAVLLTTTLPNAGYPTYRQTELQNDHHTSNP